MKQKSILITIFLLSLFPALSAQQKTALVSGEVITADGEPAEAISVFIEDTPYGTTTDRYGKFKMQAPTGKHTLVVYSFRAHRVEVPIEVVADTENHIPPITIIETSQQLGEVVVTGQFSPQSLRNSLYKVKVVGRDQIEKKGAVNAQTLLNTELGVRLSNDMALGETDFELLGMSGNNVKVLLDGVPLVERGAKKQVLSQIDINTIERVEIVEGPMSVIYGTDALAGVINIITRKRGKDGINIGARLHEESVGSEYNFFTEKGIHNQHLLLGYTMKNGLYADAGFTHNGFGGWRGNETGRALRFQSKEQYITSGTVGFIADRWKISYKPNFVNENILTLGDINELTNSAVDKEFIVKRFTQQLHSDVEATNRLRFNLAASHQSYNRRTRTTTLDMATGKRTLALGESLQDETGFNLIFGRLTAVWKTLDNLTLQPGVEYQVSKGHGDRIDGERSINQTAMFLSAEYTPIEWFSARAGVRSTINSSYKAPKAIPSINFKFGISPDMDLRLSYGRGFRAPTLQELYFSFHNANHNIDGNPDLKAEHSDSYLASWVWRMVHNNQTRYTLTVSGYFNDFKNRISMMRRADKPEFITYGNIGKYKTTGFSIENALTWKNLSAHVNFMMVGRYNLLNEEEQWQNANMTDFRFSPELSASINYDWEKVASISLFYKYTGKRHEYRIVENNPVLQGLNDYHWCDITLSHPIVKYLTANIGVRNLFNVSEVTSTVPGSSSGHGTSGGSAQMGYGRSFFAGLRFDLGR
ncbi:MAG TPA: TonB-dependent receptor [Petrimonas sp.]|jgi:outer membrane receptor for ferrienterochelin and colicins|nr:TonB-dependent receptor [Petrimonas sp.]